MARTCFEILAEAFARDVDRSLLEAGLRRTPAERIEWLEQMQTFAEDAAEARRRKKGSIEASRTSRDPE